jgi:hypothetical protein
VVASIALLVMLAVPAVRAVSSAWRHLSAWAVRVRERAAKDDDDEPRRTTVAVVREVDAAEFARTKDGTLPGRTDRGGSVGFSDWDDEVRFRPPHSQPD